MTQHLTHPAAIVSILLIILGGVSFTQTDGALRIVIGAVCIVGLLVCVRQLATRAGHT